MRPTGGEARRWLLAELSKPRYEKRNLLDRVTEWIARAFSQAVASDGRVSWVKLLIALAIFAALAAGVVWLIARTRRTRRGSGEEQPIIDRTITAADHRANAQRAFAVGKYAEVVISTFRAVATAGVESGVVEDRPASTAHEVTTQLGAAFPDARAETEHIGALFDEAAYGERSITHAEAERALEWERRLGAKR